LYLLGDTFDFWFEYKLVVPKGNVRLLAKIAEFADEGIPVHVFHGNHDLWQFGYFEKELGVQVHAEPISIQLGKNLFYIGHGDGLGPGDGGYKFLKKIFRNPICQWLFGFAHPSIGIGVANYFSRKSRAKTGNSDEIFLGEDKEWLIVYCKEVLQKEHFDYFIFGHRHLPLTIQLNEKSKYINLGDWIRNFTYAEFDGNTFELKKWED
jgi:UDP-2,3-diacylglucosamine hydrolase